MRISLDKAGFQAVNALRGLPRGVHSLVMRSRSTEGGGGVLEGGEDAFDELVQFISGEIADGMVSPGQARALRAACARIDPESVHWLGM